jgi:hypothetical protein
MEASGAGPARDHDHPQLQRVETQRSALRLVEPGEETGWVTEYAGLAARLELNLARRRRTVGKRELGRRPHDTQPTHPNVSQPLEPTPAAPLEASPSCPEKEDPGSLG